MLAWEPGCGKTRPALVAGLKLDGPILYLCPAAIREQVGDVAVALGYDPDTVLVIKTGQTKFRPAKLVVCSYDQASVTQRWKDFMGVQWAALVLDEAHNLKNQTAIRTRAVYGTRIGSPGALFRKAERIWPMTGTPILNDPSELWTHCSRLFQQVLQPNAIQTQKQWLGRYCHLKETPYGPKVLGGKNLPELNRLLKPHMSHMTLEQAQPGMPGLTVDVDRVDAGVIDTGGLPEEAMAELERLLAAAELDGGLDVEQELAALVPPLATLRRRLGLAKTNHVADFVTNELYAGTPRITLFYFHTEVGDMLEFRLQKFRPVRIDGSTTNKAKAIKNHIENQQSRVALLQVTAAGVGLDGLQHACHRVVMGEYLWVPGLNDQAIKRVYRAGQKLPVRATYVAVRNSLDDRVLEVLRRKEKIVRAVLE
jgi:hypothetical protein